MSEYWLISAPGEKTCQQTFDTMNNLTSKQHNLCNNYKFHIPDLKVGTLDQLVGLSDDLGKLDLYVEQITRKVASYLGEVLEDQRDKLQENLLANNSPGPPGPGDGHQCHHQLHQHHHAHAHDHQQHYQHHSHHTHAHLTGRASNLSNSRDTTNTNFTTTTNNTTGMGPSNINTIPATTTMTTTTTSATASCSACHSGSLLHHCSSFEGSERGDDYDLMLLPGSPICNCDECMAICGRTVTASATATTTTTMLGGTTDGDCYSLASTAIQQQQQQQQQQHSIIGGTTTAAAVSAVTSVSASVACAISINRSGCGASYIANDDSYCSTSAPTDSVIGGISNVVSGMQQRIQRGSLKLTGSSSRSSSNYNNNTCSNNKNSNTSGSHGHLAYDASNQQHQHSQHHPNNQQHHHNQQHQHKQCHKHHGHGDDYDDDTGLACGVACHAAATTDIGATDTDGDCGRLRSSISTSDVSDTFDWWFHRHKRNSKKSSSRLSSTTTTTTTNTTNTITTTTSNLNVTQTATRTYNQLYNLRNNFGLYFTNSTRRSSPVSSCCGSSSQGRSSPDTDMGEPPAFPLSPADLSVYITRFQWDMAKYPIKQSLRNIADIISKQIGQIDADLKTKSSSYNSLKGNLQSLEKKQTGSLLTRNLADLVKREHFIMDSEYLTTLLVIVPKALTNDWLVHYEKITDMIVPRSSTMITQDAEYCLFNVTLFKKVVEEFKLHARERKFIVRDFVYNEEEMAAGKNEITKLITDKKKQFGPLVRWLKVNFSEAFCAVVHVKALRVFVESVLRYGLPVNFQAILIEPNRKSTKRLREVLNQLYSHLDGSASSGSKASTANDNVDIPGLGFGQSEYYPYVFYKINIDMVEVAKV